MIKEVCILHNLRVQVVLGGECMARSGACMSTNEECDQTRAGGRLSDRGEIEYCIPVINILSVSTTTTRVPVVRVHGCRLRLYRRFQALRAAGKKAETLRTGFGL